MSIQSTIYITRKEAEQRLISILTQKIARVKYLSDDEITDELEETFYNFSISENADLLNDY